VPDTIFALSSGLPPAGIAVVRISGPQAGAALATLAGRLPAPRRASFRQFRDAGGAPLDDGLALWFPCPASATGEDLAELHLHGGRAVVAAVLAALAGLPGLRIAEAGEFTRRAFENGRIDLAEAEGLSDLLAAETEAQRRSALAMAEGGLGAHVNRWRNALLSLAARTEAAIDFSDEGDVDESAVVAGLDADRDALTADIAAMLAAPPAERLRDGVRIVLAGPPNAGKSSLFNALVGRDAAIVTEVAGTTRDRIEAPVVMDGLALLFIDTAGLHAGSGDLVEDIGMARTSEAVAHADIILWLGEAGDAPNGAMIVAAKADLAESRPGLPVSVRTGEGLAELRSAVVSRAQSLLPHPGALALNARHRDLLRAVVTELERSAATPDPLLQAEHLRLARDPLDRLTGRAGVEDMLDALFGTFCVGK
jgi:tRNA modification GTPase